MSWLEPPKVLALAGYPAEEPAPESKEADAVRFASEMIQGYTRVSWGLVLDFTLPVHLSANAMHLDIPKDTRTILGVTPLSQSDRVLVSPVGLERVSGAGVPKVWPKGSYAITGTRGYAEGEIPADVVKAASLLVAYYLGMSDPDRSRFEGLTVGDFSGTMHRRAFPVPEAEGLLRRYRTSSRVS